MNFVRFLESVNIILETMDKKQRGIALYDIARQLSEDERSSFLARLNKIVDNKANVYTELVNEPMQDHKEWYEKIKYNLSKIESEEYYLVGHFNEEYSHWYDDGKEYFFQDIQGIGSIVEDACRFIHECMELKLYEKAGQISSRLLQLNITVEGDYGEYMESTFTLADLKQHDIGELDYKQFLLESLYVAYYNHSTDERVSVLYGMMNDFRGYNLTLESIMQCQEELPELRVFLYKWIEFLGSKKTQLSHILLSEAVVYLGDADFLLQIARTNYLNHPELYEKYINEQRDKVDVESIVLVGKEALERINVKYIIRSRIALLLAEILLKGEGDVTNEIEHLWVEAFRSESCTANFLRILRDSREFSAWKKELEYINHEKLREKPQKFYPVDESHALRENIVSRSESYFIAFLNGEYEFVKNNGMGHGQTLGWTNSYMKQGVAAFILVLLNTEQLSNGGKAMQSMLMPSDYLIAESLDKEYSKLQDIDKELLWESFVIAKKKNQISQDLKEQYISWIMNLIEKRVDSIMQGDFRNYYGECAAYIAAIGEMLESKGVINAKQCIMNEYKAKYPRRRNFIAELKRYGMH